MTMMQELEQTMKKLGATGKGILAADESVATITKRFTALNIQSTEETRRDYREMLITTPGLSDYIAGVIFFEETLNVTIRCIPSEGNLAPGKCIFTGENSKQRVVFAKAY